MKIVELTNYSAGGCGVGARVKREASILKKRGHEVMIFSSDFIKGKNDERAPAQDVIDGVPVRRFRGVKLGGESFMSWNEGNNLNNAIKEFKPDVIIAHAYRHTHTRIAVHIAKKIGAKLILVTHAPFARERGFVASVAVAIYDRYNSRFILPKYDKVIAISKWEIPYLVELGVPKDKIEYIPNGINREFFSTIKGREENKIIYTGRVSRIKNLEIVIKAMHLLSDKKIIFEIFGPAEQDYIKDLRWIAKDWGVKERVNFIDTTYGMKEQIREVDSARFFVLPSKSEGMPQALVEAMARKKIVIASDNPADKDLIKNRKNGMLFENGNYEDFAKKMNTLLNMNKNEIQKIKDNARKSVEKFEWDRIADKIEELIES